MDIDNDVPIDNIEGHFEVNSEKKSNSSANVSEYEKYNNLLQEWSEILGIDTSKIFEKTVRNIIVDKFDIKSDESLLSSPDLIKLPYWRNIIYELEEKMQNTPKLQSVIKLIIESGYENELAQSLSSGQYKESFSNSLVDCIINLSNINEELLPKHLHSFLELCSQNVVNYIYSQMFLFRLINDRTIEEKNKYLIRYLSLKLDEHIDKIDPSIKYSNIFSEALISSIQKMNPDFIVSIRNMRSEQDVVSLDITRVYNYYKNQRDNPSIEFLRHPNIYKLLLKEIFSNSNQTQSKRDIYTWLLAYATSTNDEDDIMERDKNIKETVDAINHLNGILKKITPNTDLKEYFMDLLKASNIPITSMALISWIENTMDDANFSDWYNQVNVRPLTFDLLNEAAIREPLQRDAIFNIYKKSFEKQQYVGVISEAVMELKKRILSEFIFLMKTDYVIPVLNYMVDNASKIDESLSVYFVQNLISMIEPPYPQDIALLIIKIISQISIKAFKTSDNNNDLSSFLEQCLLLKFDNDEKSKIRKMIQDLSS
ncbi:hypothetical protein BCR32DRAFT_327463 [Anaeromyces robustus]|uniref:Uncharacterized protein n=1 Tax=Anaeromyces robustus TaxID=1754192 RepID=A0A1Y1X5F5_9FUNG|nr:hypothetical protein BCR32DRAFT_327463 [Anaeromyces robustus]|eukprot:ORX81047.1 hypothetical protein BCR32DRAFT_327463 [Anaeromyces robustus]